MSKGFGRKLRIISQKKCAGTRSRDPGSGKNSSLIWIPDQDPGGKKTLDSGS
jgi:hypothetical protein